MIEQIEIKNFGSFKNFDWNSQLRDKENNVAKFKKLNIIYGRNYSGKTNLSRIVRSLETGTIPKNYSNPFFKIFTTDHTVTEKAIERFNLDIRVYNKDFVDEHLSFLRDDEGKITPFAIIGDKNKAIEKRISELEDELGSIEGEIGLRHKHSLKKQDYLNKKEAKDVAEKNLKDKLTKKATQPPSGIKHSPLYRDPNYNTPKIEDDIKYVRENSFGIISDKEKNNLLNLLEEEELPDINIKLNIESQFDTFFEKTNEFLQKKIKPTEPIQELLNDALLQVWVKEGITLHKEKRDECGFCGQTLPDGLWQKLNNHFSKESKNLEDAIKNHIEKLESEQNKFEKLITVKKDDFYNSLQDDFEKFEQGLKNEISAYLNEFENQINVLEKRLKDIFKTQPTLATDLKEENIKSEIEAINDLIKANNKKTTSLDNEKAKARKKLRLNEIAQFVKDIELTKKEEKILKLEEEVQDYKGIADDILKNVHEKEKEIEKLNLELKDEKQGAEKVNEYLNNYFGHEGLKLEALEEPESSSFKFQIKRGEELAYNLSEGECSLVAFCYFLAKLEDSESKGKQLIIWIDDPISSLDDNHIFFVYSLIESIITKPNVSPKGTKTYNYLQLFISTHNLDFLKYLKRISKPKKNHEQFLLTAHSGNSDLKLMPAYLKLYITEFNYLFNEIYICSNPKKIEEHYPSFYNFGNNLRKFLEALLYFKYPFSENSSKDYNKRIEKFFKDEPSDEPLVQRLTNEFSHLGERFDRGRQPIDQKEISKLAEFVLIKIKNNDIDQYRSLLESINEVDPL